MNPTSTQLPTLQLGSQGAAVRTLQHLLNQRVSRDYIVAVDGIFSAKTKQAVAVFQYSKLLRRDGIVSAKTWLALETNMPAAMPLIRRGSKGEAVSIAQAILKEGGLYLGCADGNFGTQTEMVVRSFQAHQNLVADGIVGNQTWLALSNLATYLAFD
ncbi:peptidoglycan-binding domain-containing protein [Leptolyngbya ohadii]|uniref:peptidoglycan-binding domain-containing protein n=1 Tax=Leptolyngbya ohadii TaxID=1962290 RepID=UPI000B59D705|nr:peptidoglycan-binding protein [Leptolyngbya ohadii]